MRELICRVVAFLLIAGGLWGQQSATIAESDAYRVEFLETVDASGSRADIRHDFAVTPKNGADPFRLSTKQSWQFYSLEFVGRLLLVHGALGGNALTTAIVDLDKNAAPPINSDGTSLGNDDWAWAVFQKVQGVPSNEFNISVGDRKFLSNYVAVLGDSFVIEGVRIKFVATGDYETIEISRG